MKTGPEADLSSADLTDDDLSVLRRELLAGLREFWDAHGHKRDLEPIGEITYIEVPDRRPMTRSERNRQAPWARRARQKERKRGG